MPIFSCKNHFLRIVRKKETQVFSPTYDFGSMTLGINNINLVLSQINCNISPLSSK